MNKSEQLLSAFSEDYFFKDLVIDDLCFTPEGASVMEVADLVINLGDIIIAIQLKSRNDEDQTDNSTVEIKWLQKKCKIAKGQAKETLQFISSGTLPTFCNKRGQSVTLRPDAEVIPLVVFENSQIGEYPHLLRKHSDTGMNINCMSFPDYCEMCRVLITPMEIIEYLEYRKAIYEEHGNIDIMISDGYDGEIVLTKPMAKEALVHQFLTEKYGAKESAKQELPVQYFRSFLHQLPDHTVLSSTQVGSYEILRFLAHFHRDEINEFWNLFKQTQTEAQQGARGIRHSLRSAISEYVIMFMANGMVPIEGLLSIIRKVTEPKQVLGIDIYWFDEDAFGVDFLFWDDTK